MGLIRTLIIFLLIYLVVRYILRRVLSFSLKFPQSSTTQQRVHGTQDKIVPCPTCGTYNPTQNALQKQGEYFCNEGCVKKNQLS